MISDPRDIAAHAANLVTGEKQDSYGHPFDDFNRAAKIWEAILGVEVTAEQVAQAYRLRWNIESFFGWWKRHLKVYHLIARSKYGLMVQLLGGLITYLLLAIYCREQHDEPVSINRVRELRNQIANEAAEEAKRQRMRSSSKRNQIRRTKRKKRHAKT
jgi:hypothetical protein